VSTCHLYKQLLQNPDREFYGPVQANCGNCQQWDRARERCKQEADLKGKGVYNGQKDQEGDRANKKPGKAV